MTMTSPPRIKGRVGVIEAPHEDAGKFAYEVSIWDFYGETQLFQPFVFGPFNDEESATNFGREKVKSLCQSFAETNEEVDPTRYMDMKNGGVLRPWEVH